MESVLRELVGTRVRSLEHVHDYAQLWLGDAVLTIINPFQVSDPERPSGATLESGSVLEDVRETDDALILVFSGGTTLSVDLRDDAHAGPEAVVLRKANGETVVW